MPRLHNAGPRRVDPLRPLGHPLGAPLAGAELAAVDDALVLVAGGAEQRGAGHRAVRDLALEAVGDDRRLVAAVEGEEDAVGVDGALDRPLELRRALVAGDVAAALLER